MLPAVLLGLVACHVTGSNAASFSFDWNPEYNPYRPSRGDFSTALFQEISKREYDNFVCSPISASVALSMAASGSESTTRQQIENALGVTTTSNGNTYYLDNIRSRINSFDNYREVTLRLASKMFIDVHFPIDGNFVYSTNHYFGSEAKGVEFRDAGNACDTINEWCSAQSNQRLNSIIGPRDIDDGTGIVIANVAYFLGSWENPFPTERSAWRRFWVRGNEPEDRMTMRNTGFYNYGQLPDVDAAFLELPYRSRSDDDGVSMFVILPNERNGLRQLKRNLGSVTADRLQNGDSRRVAVSLPKFTIESTIDLEEPLKNLGVTDMFGRKADFRRISDVRGLKVDGMIQKVALDVNEGGTEGVSLNFGSSGPESYYNDSVDFVVDHPFVCMIVTKTGATLFSAIINSPFSYSDGVGSAPQIK